MTLGIEAFLGPPFFELLGATTLFGLFMFPLGFGQSSGLWARLGFGLSAGLW